MIKAIPIMVDACAAIRESYEDFLTRAEQALQWLVDNGVRVDATRAQKLIKSVRRLSVEIASGKSQHPNLSQLWDFAELDDLIQIATQLTHIKEPRFFATLKKVTGGPHILAEEKTTGGNPAGRNATFELFAAARFARANLPVIFASTADATIQTPLGDVALECKRIAVADALENNIGEAAKQIRNRILDDGAKAGIICVSISRLVHQVAFENRENIFANTLEIQDKVRLMLTAFGDPIVAVCRDLAPSVFAVGLHFKLPFVDKTTLAPTMLNRFMQYSLLDKHHPEATHHLADHIDHQLQQSVR